MMTIKELLRLGANKLRESESATPILDAELMIVYLLQKHGVNIDRNKLILRYDEKLQEDIEAEYKSLINRRLNGEPVQYITCKQEFMGLDLFVKPGVLIPRPDTEIIVEKVMELAGGFEKPRIIDMCTGSGAIAISLAYYIKEASVSAVDISECAIECCSYNIRLHNLQDRVTVVKSDLFAELDDYRGKADIIVSNPPYIPDAEIDGLSRSVKDYEPLLALDGGSDGLDFYRRIVYNSVAYLKSGGILAFEIGYNQGQAVAALLECSGHFRNIGIAQDLAGLDRCVWAYMI